MGRAMKPMPELTRAPLSPVRIGVVRNPRSHRNKGAAAAPAASEGVVVAAPASRKELGGVLAGFAEQGIGLIVVDGGDGTVRDVLTRGDAVFGDAWPRLMVLPKGKTNALALDLGMPAKMTLDAALGGLAGARIERRRALRIERIDGEGPPVFGFILGAGVFNAAIDAAQVTHRLGAFQGLAVGLTVVIGTVLALAGIGRGPWRALWPTRIVLADGGEMARSRHGRAGERWALGLSTLRTFPLGMKPFAGADADGDSPIAVLAVDAPLRRVVARAPLILAGAGGARYAKLGVHRAASARLELELGGRFVLDGEIFPPGAYRIGLGPELEFLVP